MAPPADACHLGDRARHVLSRLALDRLPGGAFGFVAIVLRYLGAGWTAALLTGVLSAAGSYVLFAVLLDVPLPRGPW